LYVDNSIDFIQQVREINMEEGDQMVSFDVVNLFPSVPRNEAMHDLQENLERDPKLLDMTELGEQKLMELVNLSLDSTYFQIREHFYEQTLGLLMGSPLSPILADLFMEKIEKRKRTRRIISSSGRDTTMPCLQSSRRRETQKRSYSVRTTSLVQ
jgi:hypothetical protein